MLDLLAAIVSADPPSLVAWLVLAFAAGMYPVGIMLGSSCSPCCGESIPPCNQCTQGELPDTLTVTFDGLQDRLPGPDLCPLTFSAPYGYGAAGKVTAPGGDPATDTGPISAVSLTSGGSGYAKMGRVAPTITASGGSGTGATFSVSTASSNDANGIPSWSVTGVTFTGTTSGYVDGDWITFNVSEGDSVEQGAAATIRTLRAAPTVTASAYGGSGATFGVTIAPNGTTPQTWSVTGVSVTNGGTGYPANGYLTFSVAGGDTVEWNAEAFFYSGRTQPTLSLSAGGSGSGAVLSASLSSATGWDGQTYWYLSGISITNGGSGYAEYDPVSVTVTDGEGSGGAYAEVTSVDGSGAITGIAVYWGGEYYKSDGIIQSVSLYGGGTYYRDAGEISSVTLESGGKYYREDASLPPYVASVTVGVSQTAPSNGTGATLTATVEDDTASPQFGQIASVSITNGGSGYLAWEWRNSKCCGHHYNGQSFVLKRSKFQNPLYPACAYGHAHCGADNVSRMLGRIVLYYNGPAQPPQLQLETEWYPSEGIQWSSSTCNAVATASSNVVDCGDWSGITFSVRGGTATVTAGGDYDPLFRNPLGGGSANGGGTGGPACNVCCQGHEQPPQEITVSVSGAGDGSAFDIWRDNAGQNPSVVGDYDGDFVLSIQPKPWAGPDLLAWSFDPPPITAPSGAQWNKPPLTVSIEPCSTSNSNSNNNFGQDEFGKDQYGCDLCNKKCRIVFSYVGYEQRFCKGNDPNHCGSCLDAPKCSPVGASFTMCAPRFPDSNYGRLGAVWQINPNPPPIPGTPVDWNDCTDYGPPPEWSRWNMNITTPSAYFWPLYAGPRCTMQVTIS